MSFRNRLLHLLLVFALLSGASASASAQGRQEPPPPGKAPAAQAADPSGDLQERGTRPLPTRESAGSPDLLRADPVLQDRPVVNTLSGVGAPIQSWEGISNTGVLPPDTDGQVGRAHYLQIVNAASEGSWIRVWDKTGLELYNYGLNSLWPAGDPCRTMGYGDPVVLYDQLADRWLLSQFINSAPYYECIAVSKGPVPSGSSSDWYLYSFLVHNTKFNDYPKLGVWPNGYFMMAHQFSGSSWAGSGVWAFNRTAMLNGLLPQAPTPIVCSTNPTACQYKDLAAVNNNYGGLLPVNLMGNTLPPEGSPNYFIEVDYNWSGSTDVMTVFGFHVDWATPANTKFGRVGQMAVADYDASICVGTMQCIQQSTSTVKLDAISDRLMMHAWYRNMGDYETIVLNHTVDATSAGRAGIRWYEIRKTNPAIPSIYDPPAPPAGYPYGPWSIYQSGTYSPDAHHRWMGSIAMDRSGNIALGFSISSASRNPGINYAGRTPLDPLGTLSNEQVLRGPGGAQTHSSGRWGDYSALSVDPVDDCTFWYTQEWVQPGSAVWTTWVGSFMFPDCSPPDYGTLSGVITDADTGLPVEGAAVSAVGALPVHGGEDVTNELGEYSLHVPSDTYTLSASAYAYHPAATGGIVVAAGADVIQNLALSPAPMYTISGTVTEQATGRPVYARIDISGFPGSPLWTDPETGQYSVTMQSGFSHTFTVRAVASGFTSAARVVEITGPQTQNFVLSAVVLPCTAPGYSGSSTVTFSNGFEGMTTANFPGDGWVQTKLGGTTDQNWTAPTSGTYPTAMPRTGARMAKFNSYDAGPGMASRLARTNNMDLTAYPGAVVAFWMFHGSCGYSGNDNIQVQVSTDAGATWTNAGEPVVRTNSGGWTQHFVDISAFTGPGMSTVRIALLATSGYGCNMYVDDVTVLQAACSAQPGALVFGNTYDGNTLSALNGVQVGYEGGSPVASAGTPLDPGLDDGFYMLFSPAGLRTFTAAGAAGYGPAQQALTVPTSGVLRQDFHLPAGRLEYQPDSLAAVVEETVASADLALTNTGGRELAYSVAEMPARLMSGLVSDMPDWYRSTDPAARQPPPEVRKPRLRSAYQFILDNVYLSTRTYEVLVLTPDTDLGYLLAGLAPFNDLDVSVWDSARGEPALADLLAYDVVMVGNDRLWVEMDKSLIGDRLADYIDQGGKVIEGLYVQSFDDWGLSGRYMSGGYSPFSPATEDYWVRDGVTVLNPESIMTLGASQVVDLWGHQNPRLQDGALQVAAYDTTGSPYLAFNENVVALNQLLHQQSTWAGDVGRILHNSVLFLVGAFTEDVPWLSVSPASGSLDPDASQVVQVSFNPAFAPDLGAYHALLVLNTDTPYGGATLPVTATFTTPAVCSPVSGVSFAWTPENPLLGEPVSFTAGAVQGDGPFTYTWDYGDGSSGSGASAAHTFAEAGEYTVSLTVSNTCPSQASLQKSITISLPPAQTTKLFLPVMMR